MAITSVEHFTVQSGDFNLFSLSEKEARIGRATGWTQAVTSVDRFVRAFTRRLLYNDGSKMAGRGSGAGAFEGKEGFYCISHILICARHSEHRYY